MKHSKGTSNNPASSLEASKPMALKGVVLLDFVCIPLLHGAKRLIAVPLIVKLCKGGCFFVRCLGILMRNDPPVMPQVTGRPYPSGELHVRWAIPEPEKRLMPYLP